MVAVPAAPSRDDVARILAGASPLASRRQRPAGRPVGALAVLVGLPGSGKSWVAEQLRARTGAAVLESDALRRLLFRRPTYSAEESRRLFAAIHGAVDALLAEGVSVVLDATNLAESERVPLYGIAERRSASLVLVRVTAPGRTIRRRLGRRGAAGASLSEADVRVYERMRARVEEMQRPHHVVDTSQETDQVLAAIAKEMMAP